MNTGMGKAGSLPPTLGKGDNTDKHSHRRQFSIFSSSISFVLHCTVLTIFLIISFIFKIKIQLYHSFIHCPLSKLSHIPFFPIFQLWPLFTLTVIIYIKWICICTYICMYMSKCANTTRLVCIMLLIFTISGITIWITNWCAHPSGRLVIPLQDFLVSLLFFY